MRRLTLTCLSLALATAGACKKDPPPAAPAEAKPATVAVEPRAAAATGVTRAEAKATDEEQQAVSARDLVLGARLLARTTPGKNAVLSPWSLAQALAMTEAGARGDTAKAFEAVLKGPMPEADWHRTRSATETAIASRGAGASGKGGGAFRLHAFNRLYGSATLSLEQPYLASLAAWYGAGLTLLDFARAPEPSRQHINGEVAKATEALIPELLRPGQVTATTALVLVNAVYFNGGWAKPFDKARTAPAPFHLADGTEAPVPTMNAELHPVRAAEVDGVQLLELPYDGKEVSMLVLMPFEGGLPAVEQRLADGWLDGALGKLEARKANLALPRFKLRTALEATEALKALGLAVAFGPSADFSGMSKTPLGLDAVVHEAVVDTDEEGTEAAAATAVVARMLSVHVPYFVRIDRPFLFLLRDGATGAPLFLGRVMDPR